ncbi:MAG: MFS transporter [Nanoarchaeota archaeon]|nr:MFS transporter [Nanoarchaeota archaeon]
MNSSIRRLYPIQVAYLIAVYFTNALLLLWFLKMGIAHMEMAVFYLLIYALALVFIACFRSIKPRLYFIIGIGANIALFVVYAAFFSKELLYFMPFLYAPAFLFFWINYNIAFFKGIEPEKKATGSALYVFAFSLLSAIMPIIAGYTAVKLGMPAIFWISAVIMVVALLLSFRIKAEEVHYRISNCLKCIKGVKTLIFLEGFWEHTTFIAIPLISLFFINEELKLGAYLSYLGLTGAVASIFMAKISDRAKKRKEFIFPLAIALAIATMLVSFGSNIYLWVIFTGLLYLISPALKPFQTTVALDNAKCGIHELMIAREFLLNLGRFCGVLVFIAAIFLGITKGSIFIAAIAMAFYPLVMKWKGHYRTKPAASSS